MKQMLIAILFFLVSCQQQIDKSSITKDVNSLQQKNEPFPISNDTIDILYFKKTQDDKERYQRFFKVAHIKDSLFVKKLNTAINGMLTEDLLTPKECRSEGKIIVPIKGDAFKVIYFSRLETKCPYLYIIENGHFLYYNIDSSLNAILKDFETKAIEP